jgi:hypothetical protein
MQACILLLLDARGLEKHDDHTHFFSNVSDALGSAIDSAAGHASSAVDKAAGATAAGSRRVAAADTQQKQLLSAGQAAAAAIEQLSGGVAEGLKAAASMEGPGLEGSLEQGMDQMIG